jgi:hypothetical protein
MVVALPSRRHLVRLALPAQETHSWAATQRVKARLHGSSRLINAVESTEVNRVNSSFQRK